MRKIKSFGSWFLRWTAAVCIVAMLVTQLAPIAVFADDNESDSYNMQSENMAETDEEQETEAALPLAEIAEDVTNQPTVKEESDEPSFEEDSNTEQPTTGNSDTEQPATENSEIEQPATEETDVQQPETAESEPEQPDEEKSELEDDAPGEDELTEEALLALMEEMGVSMLSLEPFSIQWGYGAPAGEPYCKDGSYYLFAPESADLSEITLHLSGVVSVDKGTLSEDGAVLSGAFAEDGDTVVLVDSDGTNIPVSVVVESDFAAKVVDSQGYTIESWFDSESSEYILFLTGKENISAVTVRFSGAIVAAESGTLNIGSKTLAGAFSGNNSSVEVEDNYGNKYTLRVMQSSLPSVCISLKGTTLSEIHRDKDVKWPGNTVVVASADGVSNFSSVEIKGRGNTSWQWFEKKGYQIKLEKKKSLLGMGAAKKWVLLANASDETLVRNMLAFNSGRNAQMRFTPNYKYVDLWIAGEYRGVYILGEKIEIGSSRLNLTDDYAAIFELDNAFYSDELYNFYNEMSGNHFTVKDYTFDDTDTENINQIIDAFQVSLDSFYTYLRSNPGKNLTIAELQKFIDVDSFAQFYLINEFYMNKESMVTSFYWYKDGLNDILHLGPIWDFDTSMGIDGGQSTVKHFSQFEPFNYLLTSPEFVARVNYYKNAIECSAANAESLRASMGSSCDLNFVRWNIWGKVARKSAKGYYSNSYAEGFQELSDWLVTRDGYFSVSTEDELIAASVDAKCENMSLVYRGAHKKSQLKFAVWSSKDGQDDLHWYQAAKDGTGSWIVQVPLKKHYSRGLFYIHAYTNNESGTFTKISEGRAFVASVPVIDVSANLAQNGDRIVVTAADVSAFSQIRAAVWGAENGQNDLTFYAMQKDSDGVASCTTNLTNHKETGKYYVHIYGTRNGTEIKLAETTLQVTEETWPSLTTEVDESAGTLKISLSNGGDYRNVRFPVWGAENDQNDLNWYVPTQKSNGVWEYTVNLADHAELGTYYVHVYGTKNGVQEQITAATVSVTKLGTPAVKAVVSSDAKTMKVTLSGAEGYAMVRFPIWGTEDGQNDLKWYVPTQKSNGVWEYTVNLADHAELGTYHIHIYGTKDGTQQKIATTTVNISKLGIPAVKAVLSSDAKTMKVRLIGADDYSLVRFPIWAKENGQNDLKWYVPTEKGNGVWEYTVNLADHAELGEYHIHVYGTKNGIQSMIAQTSVTVTEIKTPVVKAVVSAGKKTMTVTLTGASDYTNVQFPVWGLVNNQNDLKWYTPVKDSNGVWQYTVKLDDHGEKGVYAIHVYGTINGTHSQIAGTFANVD